MAEEDLSLDDPKEKTESEEGEETGGKKKKLIIIIAAAVAVVLIGGGAAAYFLLSGDEGETSQPVAESELDGAVIDESEAAIETEKKKAVPVLPEGEAIYISIPEPFLVNITSGKKTRMMQIKVQFMVRSKEAEDIVKQHMPLIRNNILDFFSMADANEVRTREGRTELKNGALVTANNVLKEQVGIEAVEMVLFTGFVVQ